MRVEWNAQTGGGAAVAAALQESAGKMPERKANHRIPMPGGPWAVWRWVALRSAGFAADDVLTLASPDCSAAADRFLQMQSGAAQDEFDLLFSRAREAASRALRAVAASPRFREALTWQNHPLLGTCIEPLLRSEAGKYSKKTRQHEEVLTSYWHRYTVKNDTIGFFGPVGWAKFTGGAPGLEVEPGADLLSARQVYFEQWAMDELARHFSNEESLKPWIIARPTPVASICGLEVRVPFRDPIRLTPEEMAVFQACDGSRATQHLAEWFCRPGSESELPRETLLAILARLESLRLISLRYELPLDAHPEQRLRDLLNGVEDDGARKNALAALEQLDSCRAAVAAAAGDPESLHRALLRLDSQFTALTGTAPNRSPGEMYSGRTLVFEDCRRDVRVPIGAPILDSLGPPLSLVLESARWVTYQAGKQCRAALTEVFDRMAQAGRSNSVSFAEFYNYAFRRLAKNTGFLEIAAELEQRWTKILAVPVGTTLVRHSSQALKARVKEAFAAPEPGWPGACYHSPDLMIAASSIEAINAGDFEFVLGELHMGANTLRGQFLIEQHPQATDIFEGIDADLPGIRLAPITPRRYSQRATRIYPVLTSEHQYLVATTLDSIPPPGSTCLPAASLRVRKLGGRLVAEITDGTLQFDVLQSFAAVLAKIVIDRFSVLPRSEHTPRVVFDRLIVARETWRFAPAQMDFANLETSTRRFLATRRWKASHGLPRWVFVRIPGEGKPIYVDFDSPLAVDILARRIRNRPQQFAAQKVIVSEMCPNHGQHWLTDREGRRYSCELRVIAVDRQCPGQPRNGK